MLTLSGGKWKGKRFAEAVGANVRPTAIRAREGLFNVLEHRFGNMYGQKVADLFAGTGALGLEALSRGADYCCFVELDAKTKRNLESLITSVSANARVLGQDATNLKSVDEPFDLIFLDPPYGANLIEGCLRSLNAKGWLKSESLVVVELDAKETLPDNHEFTVLQDRKWGRNRFLFLELI